MLLPKFGAAFPLPRRALTKPLFWAFAPFAGVTRRYVSGNVGHQMRFDNSKATSALGMSWRRIDDSVNEMFAQLVDAGVFTKRRRV